MTTTVPLLSRYAGPPTVPGFAVDRFLGRGSTGVVWAATEEDSGRRVALKVLESDGVALELLDREEALGSRLGSAHLVTVRGRVPLDDGRVAVVMRLAGGGTLRDVVTVRGALPLGEVVTALTPMATALSELHAAGVVHVDVAPGNVLFTADGRPLLTDLSSARSIDDGWPTRSAGTPGFAAPEVVLGRPAVPASDVWSLGALAWYARTGGHTPPTWVGELHWAMSVGQVPVGGPLEDVGTVDDVTAAVGPELTPLLLRMLAEDPEVRPSAAEVALGLYRAGPAAPVGLVGHHPDPAAAVTTRIRREAAETRSRTQLRAEERAELRLRRREVRRSRLRRLVVPWRLRLAIVVVAGLVLAGGMLGLLRLTGGPLEVVATTVADTSGSIPPDAATSSAESVTSAPSNGPPAKESAQGSAAPGNAAPGDSGLSDAAPGDSVPGDSDPSRATASPSSAGASSVMAATSPAEVVARDPVGALQQLADRRAAALMAADEVLLAGLEPAGSSAHESDRQAIEWLREQHQRYADLAFVVTSAEVLSATSDVVVLRAVVDRSAYRVVTDGGEAQAVAAAP
ncbi:MAG TPA: serine/threonine-protein kinase, partial [Lapillicoccus sp.]|nr:serine/threonine-protein kinase [Lapillicoccus sp.]